MFVGEMPDQVGHGPLRVRGAESPLIISDGVHPLGERRLRGEEDRDQVITRHTPSLRVCFEPNGAGSSCPCGEEPGQAPAGRAAAVTDKFSRSRIRASVSP